MPAHRSLLPLPAPPLLPDAEPAARHHAGVHPLVPEPRPCQNRQSVRRRLRDRVPAAVADEQTDGFLLQNLFLLHPTLGHHAPPLHTLQEPFAEQLAELGLVVSVDDGAFHHPQEPVAARLEPDGELPELVLGYGLPAAEADVHHRPRRLRLEPPHVISLIFRRFTCRKAHRSEWTNRENRWEPGCDGAIPERSYGFWLERVEGIDQEAVCFGELSAVSDELLGEEVLGVVQRLRDGSLGDAVHARDADVADGAAGIRVEVGGEVDAQGEHRGGGGEEDVAGEAEVPGDGYDDGGQRDVRHERRRAGAGEERAEEGRGAAHGLEAEEEGVGAGELGCVERREVEVEAAHGRARAEQGVEVRRLGGRHGGEHGGDRDAAAVAGGGEGHREAAERDEVAHPGAREEHDVGVGQGARGVAGGRHCRRDRGDVFSFCECEERGCSALFG
ncbi:hypothetical protein CFC21_108587 [Triticum aestivum]|uniref:Uncharacterized protein n=2 Tax=Triticum aestivum TaxID=4565 RepID=A0A3B6THF2_WHEAT|nr:hypothetical protein CFC21_108587 [Triticum aestivum]